MKRKILIFFAALSAMAVLLSACGSQKSAGIDLAPETEIKNVETENAKKEALVSEDNQPRAILFCGDAYLSWNGGIYKLDSDYKMKQIMECRDAVGRLRDGYLYWAVWALDDSLQIVRIDSAGEISEVGVAEEGMPIKELDFYKDILYIRYKLGNVAGYHIGADGKLSGKATGEEMLLYADENRAAKIRRENPDNIEAILGIPEHIIGAGYSIETYGKEFLTKHTGSGEQGSDSLIVRSGGQDTEPFTYFEKAYPYQNKIIYYEDADKNKLAVYDMDKKESSLLYVFSDGSFELSCVEDNRVYGVWNSIADGKAYFVGIDLEAQDMTVYFDVGGGSLVYELAGMAYYTSADDGSLKCEVLDK